MALLMFFYFSFLIDLPNATYLFLPVPMRNKFSNIRSCALNYWKNGFPSTPGFGNNLRGFVVATDYINMLTSLTFHAIATHI
ncbi:uncharacterized protein F4822DRAFT_246524 [Hypoxylon trugodes]|uniref:uncharacterized protein n=1 Tax=Hypoxylon trugodes TaxID=326681 RepID=UPI00218E713D|nr:uncharacterized protein F4822DRAFT_246524 [Hypoxylon trugodes]KAI1388433.1 hypothetical protein F4822DRAFT_246524 [Hypoxylon trugodes]